MPAPEIAALLAQVDALNKTTIPVAQAALNEELAKERALKDQIKAEVDAYHGEPA